MFEMLGLKEDALIQYDELDAMFDQSVENFASGGKVFYFNNFQIFTPITAIKDFFFTFWLMPRTFTKYLE